MKNWRLNERHYGALQGLNKADTAARLGEERVLAWRRSWDGVPPLLDAADERHPIHDLRYRSLSPTDLPGGESLKMTVDRVLPYWEAVVAPALQHQERVLVVAHGNSLRGLVKHLSGISDSEIATFELPTGVPLAYEIDPELPPVRREFLN